MTPSKLMPRGCRRASALPRVGHAGNGLRLRGPARRGDRGLSRRRLRTPQTGSPRATAEVGIGENYHRKGLFDEALRHLDIALMEVGYPRPTSLLGKVLHISKNALFVHCLPRRLAQYGKAPDRDRGLDIAFAAAYECLQIAPLRSMLVYINHSYQCWSDSKEEAEGPNIWPYRMRNSH